MNGGDRSRTLRLPSRTVCTLFDERKREYDEKRIKKSGIDRSRSSYGYGKHPGSGCFRSDIFGCTEG